MDNFKEIAAILHREATFKKKKRAPSKFRKTGASFLGSKFFHLKRRLQQEGR